MTGAVRAALAAGGTTPSREIRGGGTTFLTMAYILFANPAILSAAGIPVESAVAATAAAAALCSILMGLGANFPMALAPGMGLNAVIAFQVAPAAGSWQAAMGLVVLDGLLVLALVLLGLREAVMLAIPPDLRRAIGGGIGLFLALIGAVNARLVVVPQSTIAGLTRDPASILPPVTAGTLRSPETALALAGLIVIGIGLAVGIRGAIVLGILFGTGVALLLGITSLPQGAWLGIPH
ncbi:MAG: NCS2 family permease, partial [Gemmatimonadales bacterium]